MSMIPVPRNMRIQSVSPQIKIEFFTDEEIERMKNYIQMQFKNNNRRSEIHRLSCPYYYSSSNWWEN